MSKRNASRRSFLKKTSAISFAASTPYFFSNNNAISAEFRSLNDKAPIGLIGAGGMGVGNMEAAADYVDVVEIADVDSSHADKANEKLSGGKAKVSADYRNILDRDDIKIVHIATPDHWHTKPLIEAMFAGKDVLLRETSNADNRRRKNDSEGPKRDWSHRPSWYTTTKSVPTIHQSGCYGCRGSPWEDQTYSMCDRSG